MIDTELRLPMMEVSLVSCGGTLVIGTAHLDLLCSLDRN